MITTADITGLRGFGTKQSLHFAIPNGNPGSGLTVIVGGNNAGKSTVIEAIRALAQQEAPSFSQGRRNQAAGDQISLILTDTDGRTTSLQTIRAGSSEAEFVKENGGIDITKVLVLPARRVFAPYFGRSVSTRSDYMNQMGFPPIRTSAMDIFAYRLFAIEKNRDAFNELLKRVIDPPPDWSIDQTDKGEYFLKFRKGTGTHSSEGLGEGLVSLLYIIDALYDSKDGDTIVVDEPELSLHPALQRKLAQLFSEYTSTRQLILSTHSPYFVPLEALPNGATVVRAYVVGENSTLSQLSIATSKPLAGFINNQNNPHIFGLLAQEIFFVEDRVILVEGQEDVVFFKRIEAQIQPLTGSYFGWGVGGAENMQAVAGVLHELGYKKVVGILDGNRAELANKLGDMFPDYLFAAIAANDVRTKAAAAAKPAVTGLLDDNNQTVRPEYLDATNALIARANNYLAA